MTTGQPVKVLVVGAAPSELGRLLAVLDEAGVEVVPANEFVLEARRLPELCAELPALIDCRPPAGPTYGPVRNRKKGKPARW